jgi:geranylgeranyl pyrophosphate synthase
LLIAPPDGYQGEVQRIMYLHLPTILTGDYLFARSAELAAETDHVRIVRIFAQTLMTIVGGELQQLFNDGHGRVPDNEEYYQRIYAKTASLFAAGTQTGGILCGAPEHEIQALHDYGYHLGMAFQIVDDVLDFRGDEDRIGKPVANDLRQGIATLPVMLFSEKSPAHPTILKAVHREPISDNEVRAVVTALATSFVSALVGRGFSIILSIICVATITGLPRRLHFSTNIF